MRTSAMTPGLLARRSYPGFRHRRWPARLTVNLLSGLKPSGEQAVCRTTIGPLFSFPVDKTLPFDQALPVRFRVYLALLNDRFTGRLAMAFRPVRSYLTFLHGRLPDRHRRDPRVVGPYNPGILLLHGSRQSGRNDGRGLVVTRR